MPAFRDHDRVKDQLLDPELLKHSGYQRNDFSLGQHPGLDDINLDIGKDRLELFFDKGSGDLKDPLDPQGVLGRQGCYDRGSISSQQGDDLQIGLDTRSAAGIRSGNG